MWNLKSTGAALCTYSISRTDRPRLTGSFAYPEESFPEKGFCPVKRVVTVQPMIPWCGADNHERSRVLCPTPGQIFPLKTSAQGHMVISVRIVRILHSVANLT